MKRIIKKINLIFLSCFLIIIFFGLILFNQDVKAISWSVQDVDSGGSYSSLALDTFSNPHISYRSGGDLKYAYWNGSVWNTQIVDSVGSTGEYTSLALDSSNNPHISYFDVTNTALKYAYWNGFAWVVQTIDNDGDVGEFTSLALDSSNNPHISYLKATGSYDIKYASWNGSGWQFETVDGSNVQGGNISLVLDSSNNPRICYRQLTYFDPLSGLESGYGDLKYASWNGVGWEFQIIGVNGSNYVSSSISMTLDSSNNPHISFGTSGSSGLRYAYWNGTSWVGQEADDSGENADGYSSIALDSFENPAISYYDWSNNNLKYASWNGSSWSNQTIGNFGKYTSLAFDSLANSYISYTDTLNSTLRLATGVLSQEEQWQREQQRQLQNLENGDRVTLQSALNKQSISGQALTLRFKKLPTKLTKNSKYWMKWTRHNKFPPKWKKKKAKTLKRYWKLTTNLRKYKAKKKKNKYKIQVTFKYTKKLFRRLKRKGIKKADLNLKAKTNKSNWDNITNFWPKAKVKHLKKKNRFRVRYFSKFKKKNYSFGIGK